MAQSPQLAKQMAIAGDMERVYEIAPGGFFFFFHPIPLLGAVSSGDKQATSRIDTDVERSPPWREK